MLGPCIKCNQEMRHMAMKAHEAPGTVGYGADGMCRTCRKRSGIKRTMPEKCVKCESKLRPASSRAKDYPGTKVHKGKGVCDSCVKRNRPSRAKPKVEGEVDPDTIVLTDPDPEAVASLAAWEQRRRERIAERERLNRVFQDAEAVRRQFIASRRKVAA